MTLCVRCAAFVCFVTAALAYPQAPTQGTLAQVRATHQLACGVVQEDAEYSSDDDHASRGDFDVQLCRAVALTAAVANQAIDVEVTSFLDEQDAREALRTGTVDMIATISADRAQAEPAVALTAPVFYDALALLTPVARGAHTPADLRGKRICVLAETGTEGALRAWYAAHHVDYLPFPFQEEGEMEAAYATGNCEALAGERTRLSLLRLSLGSAARDHVMLEEPLSHDAMASATRSDDPQWTAAVQAAEASLLLAEELGLHRATAAQQQDRLVRLLQRTQTTAARLGLRPDFAQEVFQAMGSYSDLYQHTLGRDSTRQLPGDLNRLRAEGGLLPTP